MKIVGSLLFLVLIVAELTAVESPLSFNRDIRPILANHCFACHGPDAGQREAELRLDVEEYAKARRGDSFAILPADAAASLLVQRIQHADPDLIMPPPHFQKPLTSKQKTILKKWVDEGAVWETHWAFRPLKISEVPSVESAEVLNEIDNFVVAQLQQGQTGLAQSELADKVTLLRRLSFDLRGLPPSLHEAEAFVSGNQSYESLIDSFLSSTDIKKK